VVGRSDYRNETVEVCRFPGLAFKHRKFYVYSFIRKKLLRFGLVGDLNTLNCGVTREVQHREFKDWVKTQLAISVAI
jgi:hypothetical protein